MNNDRMEVIRDLVSLVRKGLVVAFLDSGTIRFVSPGHATRYQLLYAIEAEEVERLLTSGECD